MKIIVGLGNPEKKYEHTRHNAGFMAVDFYLEDKEAIRCESKFKGNICELHFTAHPGSGTPIKVFFVKPQTFMNNSGEAVSEIVNFYKVNVEKDLLVIHDEVDLPLGSFKMASDSRPAGHNGVKSIVEHLGTQKLHRLRIGVETRQSRSDLATDEFVLQEFSGEQYQLLEKDVLPKVNGEIVKFILG